ncbi:hypothetical protein [Afipia sp. 1NLS2]|uniref:hypothetical protein n=1 Tax=Afipia sp. 1NLS2 TaxID=666684 RepID=UPI0001D9E75A|nr:hypothetical protein [Afipia sp. 1NLS2]EFI50035.1 hypothetical protein AfiDRAFT_3742 [Afipia sp. 1NLS2]
MPLRPTRRGFIAGSLLLPLTQTAVRADSELPSQPPNEEVAVLLRRRDELLEQQRQLDERWKIAYAQLPDWCKLGPKYRDIEGNEFGPRVGWPPFSKPIPVEGLGLLVRPSPDDLRRLFEDEVQRIGRTKAIDNYRASITDLRSQLSKRRRIERIMGLPRTADWLPIDKEIERIEGLLVS